MALTHKRRARKRYEKPRDPRMQTFARRNNNSLEPILLREIWAK